MRRHPVQTLLIILLAAMFSGGCVSSSKYRALATTTTAERTDLERRLAALQSQYETLQNQNVELERSLAGLQQGKARTEAELTAEKARLEDDLAKLHQDRTRAQDELAALNARVAEMERRTAEISAQKDEEIQRLKGTYDNLVHDLQSEIQKGEIQVTQMRDKLTVNLVEKVLFDSGRAEVKSQGEAVLQKVGAILGEVKDKDIRIEGYTDNVPIGESLRKRFATNWELSTQRATHVLRFLQDRTGLDGARLSAVGYGPFRPVADNASPEGRAQNRRIEIVLVPPDLDREPMKVP